MQEIRARGEPVRVVCALDVRLVQGGYKCKVRPGCIIWSVDMPSFNIEGIHKVKAIGQCKKAQISRQPLRIVCEPSTLNPL